MGATLAQEKAPRAPLEVNVEPTLAAPIVAEQPEARVKTERPVEAQPGSLAETSEIPPSLYARFEAFEFLGRGGMGAVYKARDFRLGREVAIKLLFGADPERGGSLLREARSQARIAHDNVCEVYEAGTADHVRFIVMQLIHGEPLDKAKSSMTLEEKARAIRQIASALHEAHRLGMVHRDVKPTNIMVERGEDGAWKPYIMDFGLAREMGDTGATVTGALMGTPSFMAPEQAAGRVRSLDRRTDVYGLGATLYDILVGRPPLIADDLASLLQAIAHEEPTAMRQIEPDVPQDLEAIVMRCLEKSPAMRYDSTKALGDDLQRFLDGEPVAARKQSLGYVAWRRAKRHKGKVALASVLLVAAAVFAGAWVRARRIAAEQAILSRELGESVKEMEFFLRNAHGLPLHDIDRERNIVRGRLKTIASWMNAAGEIGRGPGHYALGRGYLALQEPEEALAHLKQAEAVGYRSSGLDYAMGMALSELYKKALEETKRFEREQKKQRIAGIEAEYKEPALAHLKAALGGAIEAPAYVEGLIALYEGRHEEALAKGREAFEKAPWLYEAKKLEGDVLFALGSKHGHDAAFDFDEMSRWFGEAEQAYRVAAEIGSSDPALYVAMCELYTQKMNGAFEHRDPARPVFEEAKTACGRAIAASPASGLGYVKLAEAHAGFAWRAPSKDFRQTFAEAIPHAEQAVRQSPTEPRAHYVEASLWRSWSADAKTRGLDTTSAIEHAIRGYEAALRLDPAFVWAQNELCSVLMARGQAEVLRGMDPSRTLKESAGHCERAIDIEPTFTLPRRNQIVIHETRAEYLVMKGRSPAEEIRAARETIEELRRLSPGDSGLLRWNAVFDLIEARHAIEANLDPEPALARIEASVREIERRQRSSSTGRWLRGEVALIRARRLLDQERDPSIEVRAARAVFVPMVASQPWVLSYRMRMAQIEITALRWALGAGKLDQKQIDSALAFLSPMLDEDRFDPKLYVALGEIHAISAAHALGRRGDAAYAIKKGLDAVAKAFALHPSMAEALACKGRLLLLQARQSVDIESKRQISRQAVEAFEAAIEDNPLLERTSRKDMVNARRMVSDSSHPAADDPHIGLTQSL